jgi:hypothetical protein
MANAYPKQAGKKVPKGGLVDMRSPRIPSRGSGPGGVGRGRGYIGSGWDHVLGPRAWRPPEERAKERLATPTTKGAS